MAKSRASKFPGFPKAYFRFFRDLAKNNDREWFQANKKRYEEAVKEPMLAFIEAMDEPLASVSDCFVADPRGNGGSMFRIYRDVRFSRDKSPYKEHGASQFRHMAGKDAHAPGFYVHVAPGEVFFGGGVWHPPNPVLNRIRDAIVEEPERWEGIVGARGFKRRFGSVRGDGLKRAPVGYDPEHALIEDLRRKSFFAMQEGDEALATSPKLVTEVGRAFAAMSDFMEFLTVSAGHRFQLDE